MQAPAGPPAPPLPPVTLGTDDGALQLLPPKPTPAAVRCIASDQLFRGTAQVHIEHRGVLYRLRQTALGKLILTK